MTSKEATARREAPPGLEPGLQGLQSPVPIRFGYGAEPKAGSAPNAGVGPAYVLRFTKAGPDRPCGVKFNCPSRPRSWCCGAAALHLVNDTNEVPSTLPVVVLILCDPPVANFATRLGSVKCAREPAICAPCSARSSGSAGCPVR